MSTRQDLKDIITKLTALLAELEAVETCSKCSRQATTRGFCGRHYNQWRREYCRAHEVTRLRDHPESPEPDPRQTRMFDAIQF